MSSSIWFTPCDGTDYLFLLALLTLPVDGTILGFYQPFWTPISPWLFMTYALMNPRLLRRAVHRYAPLLLVPVLLIYLSGAGWGMYGMHPLAVLMSLFGVFAVPFTVCALDIAFVSKQLSWSASIRIILIAYWFAFVVGVIQWLAIHGNISVLQEFFGRLMYRSYVTSDSHWISNGVRPQFLFAEPSYIGMHLFGILLPLMWLMRNRDSIYAKRLRNLIIVFIVGSLVMKTGTRIVLDCLVAMVVVIIMSIHWHGRKNCVHDILRFIIVMIATLASFGINSRLNSIVSKGLEGDGSFLGRVYQSVVPICGTFERPWTVLTGFGAGNIYEAARQGGRLARHVLDMAGAERGAVLASGWYKTITPSTVWTMSAYTSFFTEFGLIGCVLSVAAVSIVISQYGRWTKLAVCWVVLLAYLYIQFEGYAFAALPLFIWSFTRVNDFTARSLETAIQ